MEPGGAVDDRGERPRDVGGEVAQAREGLQATVDLEGPDGRSEDEDGRDEHADGRASPAAGALLREDDHWTMVVQSACA